jgi:hypothetical protein
MAIWRRPNIFVCACGWGGISDPEVMMKAILPIILLTLASTGACADDNVLSLSLSGHRFSLPEIHVKAGRPTTVTLTNNDDQAEEFDSTTIRIEKVVAAHATGTMRWRALAPGRYPFIGEFHADTAHGVVIAE